MLFPYLLMQLFSWYFLFWVLLLIPQLQMSPQQMERDIEAQDISALIQSASQYVNETAKAIESGNSTEALELLAQIRAELNNINGNITDLIFSVSETPP